jgi:hypothetical protein
MALGIEITKPILDQKAAEAVLAVRRALDMVENVAKWLANHPNGTTDPLVTDFGYTEDEAYALRLYFQTVDTIRVDNVAISDVGRKMTGLE